MTLWKMSEPHLTYDEVENMRIAVAQSKAVTLKALAEAQEQPKPDELLIESMQTWIKTCDSASDKLHDMLVRAEEAYPEGDEVAPIRYVGGWVEV